MSDDSRKRLRALCEGNSGYVEVRAEALRELLDEADLCQAMAHLAPEAFYAATAALERHSEKRDHEVEDTDTMIRLAGRDRSFRCDCGCNVFRKLRLKPDCFKCNGCGNIYEGE